jgi:hypothetical protein
MTPIDRADLGQDRSAIVGSGGVVKQMLGELKELA